MRFSHLDTVTAHQVCAHTILGSKSTKMSCGLTPEGIKRREEDPALGLWAVTSRRVPEVGQSRDVPGVAVSHRQLPGSQDLANPSLRL